MKDVFVMVLKYEIYLDISEKECCVTKLASHNFSYSHILISFCRMKQDRLRRETQQKYERSLFTPAGLKTFRLQPSIDNTSIMKVRFFPDWS